MIVSFPLSEFDADVLCRAASGKPFNEHTLRDDGAGQFEGRAGEWAFDRWCEDNWLTRKYVNDEHADFTVGETHIGYRVDVKSKRRTDRAKRGRCDCHVEERQEDFDAAMYVFASVCTKDNVVELLGWIKKTVFWEYCTRVTAGEATDNGFVEQADAGKLDASYLQPMYTLANGLMDELRRERQA